VAFTDKQVRNGADQGGGGQNTAIPGPDSTPDIAGLIPVSVSAAMTRLEEGHAMIESPQGSGVDGHQVGAGGSMWEWDSGLAVNDVEGSGSG
jgi:hypothetical protein